MVDVPILSILTFLPLFGVLFMLLIKGDEVNVSRNSRRVAFFVASFNFLLSLALLVKFEGTNPDFQLVEKVEWFSALNISYHMGIDGISLFFVLLATFLTPLCILASWRSIKNRVKEYMIAFLVLETFMIGTFCALDAVLFYVFFEGVLIPMFIIIGVCGGGTPGVLCV